MSLLSIDQLSAGYGKMTVLHGISLTIEPGQFAAILGPNGSGKSTLIKSVYGLTHISSGSIVMAGTSLVGCPTEEVGRHGLAYVPQTQNVFTSMTIQENLQLALRNLDKDDTAQALADLFDLFPILAERRKQRAGNLSGGERQMLAIAIGWLSRPSLMMLDEPSAGLAPLFVKEIFQLLRQLCDEGITLIVVEQNARSLLQWCDYAYVLREGQIAFQGTATEILADEETIKSYLGVGHINNVFNL